MARYPEITIDTMESTYEAILSDEDLEYALPFSVAMRYPDLFNAVLNANRKMLDSKKAFDRVITILKKRDEEKKKSRR